MGSEKNLGVKGCDGRVMEGEKRGKKGKREREREIKRERINKDLYYYHF